MHIGRVGMGVLQLVVFMNMRVRFPGGIKITVRVPVMFIMNVGVRMRRRIVNVLVLVMLGEMQPDAEADDCASNKQRSGHGLPEHEHCRRRAKKRRRRKISACPGRAEMTQRIDEQREAHAVAQKADDHTDKSR